MYGTYKYTNLVHIIRIKKKFISTIEFHAIFIENFVVLKVFIIFHDCKNYFRKPIIMCLYASIEEIFEYMYNIVYVIKNSRVKRCFQAFLRIS